MRFLGRALRAALLIALLAPAAMPSAHAQYNVPRFDDYLTDGVVEAILPVGDTVYVGGFFERIGPYTGTAVPILKSTGAALTGFSQFNGDVYAITPDGSGGWFLGGDFTTVDGTPRDRIAHLLPDFSLDPAWDPGASNRVHAMQVWGDTLFVAGFFFTVGDSTRNRIAALDASTGAVLGWNPAPASGIQVEDLLVRGDTLFVGGSFTTIAGQPRDAVASFDLPTGALTDLSTDVGGTIYAMAAVDTALYLGGSFTTLDGQPRNRLAAIHAVTGSLLVWDPDANNIVREFELGDSTIFVSGSFSAIGGASTANFAEISRSTGDLIPHLSSLPGFVNAMHLDGSTLYAGGTFPTFAGADRAYLAALDLAADTALAFDPVPLDDVLTLAASGDTLFVGGSFLSINGLDRPHLAAFDAVTLEPTSFAPVFNDAVQTMLTSPTGDTLYVGGRFTTADGSSRERMAAYDLTTGTLTGFDPSVSGDVRDLVLGDSLLFLAGSFGTVGGLLRQDVASVDPVTGAVSDWSPPWDPSAFATSIDVSGDTVYVAGSFDDLGGTLRWTIAAFDANTSAILDWNPGQVGEGSCSYVQVLDHPSFPNSILVGGEFFRIGTNDYLSRGLAIVHRDSTAAAFAWNPLLSPSTTVQIDETVLVGNTLYIVGRFDGISGNDADGVGALDIVTRDPIGWEVDGGNSVRAIAITDSNVWVGGNLSGSGGLGHGDLALFPMDVTPPSAPGTLTATPHPTLDKRITLSWGASPSSDVVRYAIYRSNAAITDTTGLLRTTTENTSYSDVAPAYGTWHYRVYARDYSGNQGPASNDASAVAPDRIAPAAPTGLAGAPGAGSATLTWSPNAEGDLLRYRIHSGPSSSPTALTDSVAATDTSAVVTGLTNGVPWYFRVTAVDSSLNQSAYSPTVQVTPVAAPDSVPPVVTPPEVSVAVHQNAALTSYLDVIVVADATLIGPPSVTMALAPDTVGTALTMALISGATASYLGPYELVSEGSYVVRATGETSAGAEFDTTRAFAASFVEPARSSVVRSLDGRAVLHVAEGAASAPTYLLADQRRDADGVVYRFGPTRGASDEAVLEIGYDAATVDEPGRLFVWRVEAGHATPLPTQVFTGREVARAAVTRLGEFRLAPDPGFTGDNTVPERFAVHANRPNPFNPSTTLEYDVPEDGPVGVTVYDLTGRRVALLHDGPLAAGRHTAHWDGRNDAGRDVASGVYFVRVQVGDAARILKVSLVR